MERNVTCQIWKLDLADTRYPCSLLRHSRRSYTECYLPSKEVHQAAYLGRKEAVVKLLSYPQCETNQDTNNKFGPGRTADELDALITNLDLVEQLTN